MYGYGSICVGREASGYEICQGVIKFELPQIKENEEVVSAYLSMYQMGFQGEGNNKVIVSPISEEVNIRTLTYRKLQGKISKGYDYLLTDRYSKNERFNIDITTIVREWINNDNNYGLVFTSSNTDSYKYTTFTSFSHPQYYSQYPYIIINTEDKEGIKDYYSYETTETIRSGSVYTNISNGNLVYVKEDFSDSGNYLPANVSHIYNHYGNENKGYGIKYEISCIGKVRKTGNNEYEYEDGYSSKSYFYLNENNEYVKEYDEKVKLKENENNIEIINNDIVYQFNKKTGLIEKITDKVNEKKQTYKYNEKNKIVEISDGAGRKSYFYYDENEMLSKIVYDVNKEIKYYYNENNQLIKIEDNDGNEVNYFYDDNNLLTEIRNENEGKIIIEYDEKNKKVKKVSRYNKVNELKEYYEVNYGNYETIITYDDGYKIRYQFDKNGQTVCVSDEKGNSYYYGYGEGNNKHNIKSKSMLLTESENILKGNFFGTYNEEADGSYRLEVTRGIAQAVDIQLNKEYILSFYAKGSFGCVKINEEEYKLEDIKEDEYQLYTFIYENKEKTEMRIDIDNIDKDKTETAELHSLNNNSNDLYIKDIQLEESVTVGKYSLVKNGSFKYGTENWLNTEKGIFENEKITINGEIENNKEISQIINKEGSGKDKYVIKYSATVKDNYVIREGREIGVKIELLDENDKVKQTEIYNVQSLSDEKQYIAGSFNSKVNYKKIKVTLMMNKQKGSITFENVSLYADNFNEKYKYDEKGNEIEAIDTEGNKVKTYYNEKDKIDYQLYYGKDENEYRYKMSYQYNEKGLVEKQILENNLLSENEENRITTIEYHYDENGNLEYTSKNGIKKYESGKIKYKDNYISEYESESKDKAIFNYDEYGHLLKVKDGNNNEINYIYDENDKLIKTNQGNKYIEYDYNLLGQITRINNNGKDVYEFVYNDDNLIAAIKINEKVIEEYEYDERDNLIEDGKGNYLYDNMYRLIEENNKNKYYYGTDGKIGLIKDLKTNKETRYVYDLSDNLTVIEEEDKKIRYTYDSENRLINYLYRNKESEIRKRYQYNPLNEIEKEITETDGIISEIEYERDNLRRVKKVTYSENNKEKLTNEYSYKEVEEGKTSNIITSVKNKYRISENQNDYLQLLYSYDGNGNIKEVAKEEGGELIASTPIKLHSIIENPFIDDNRFSDKINYYYDQYNQLIREDNIPLKETIVYEYDDLGNIVSKKTYGYTREENLSSKTVNNEIIYEYEDENDNCRLTKINGEAVVYNDQGLPVEYDGIKISWQDGKIKEIEKHNGNRYIYEYDSQGRRIVKKDVKRNVITEYEYDNDKLIAETTIRNNKKERVIYEYDKEGNPISFVCEKIGEEGNVSGQKRYYYIKNITNDIIGIVDNIEGKVVGYDYEGYGVGYYDDAKDSNGLVDKNHLKYRGYYYDEETGWYYLNNRYYDPRYGRFINADEVKYIGQDGTNVSYNLYAYCLNNPVNRFDDGGNLSLPNWAKMAIGVGAITVGAVATAIAGGAVSVVLLSSLKIATSSALIGAVKGAVFGAISHIISTGSWNGVGKAIINSSINSACDGFMWGGITAGTIFTSFAAKGAKITEIGRLKPSGKKGDGYYGVKYDIPKSNGKFTIRSIELHSPHGGGPHNVWHWQQNTWSVHNDIWTISGKAIHWTIFGKRI